MHASNGSELLSSSPSPPLFVQTASFSPASSSGVLSILLSTKLASQPSPLWLLPFSPQLQSSSPSSPTISPHTSNSVSPPLLPLLNGAQIPSPSSTTTSSLSTGMSALSDTGPSLSSQTSSLPSLLSLPCSPIPSVTFSILPLAKLLQILSSTPQSHLTLSMLSSCLPSSSFPLTPKSSFASHLQCPSPTGQLLISSHIQAIILLLLALGFPTPWSGASSPSSYGSLSFLPLDTSNLFSFSIATSKWVYTSDLIIHQDHENTMTGI